MEKGRPPANCWTGQILELSVVVCGYPHVFLVSFLGGKAEKDLKDGAWISHRGFCLGMPWPPRSGGVFPATEPSFSKSKEINTYFDRMEVINRQETML